MSVHGATGEQATVATATAQIGEAGHPVTLHRIIVTAAATTPTITLRNGTATGTAVLTTHAVAAGDVIEIGLIFKEGLHYTEAGAITATFIWS